jgi:xanthine dehydrogenase YagR molybdenum-binding subunit
MNAIGQPVSPAEGRLKVTGGARYTADIPVKGTAHAALVHSTIANGRTVSINTSAAEDAPGVLAVFTHRTLPRMNPTPRPWSHLHPHGQGYLPLQDDKIHYSGQPLALVVAETRDKAAYAGTLIKVEQTYTTSDRHHNQMEPHATTAVWDADGSLTLYETTQHIFGTKELVAIVLGLPPGKINVISHFLGGGFGGKGYVWPHTLLAALAAKVVGRPIKMQLTRAQMYSMAGHQPATIQTVTLGAERNGKLTGIRHQNISPTPVFDNYIEYAALASRSLWAASGGIATSHRIVHVNRNTPTAMRSPHEALGHFALESAMDELAYATGVDPVELRLLNDTEVDPLSGRPFSTRAMRRCLIEGAARFGWDRRNPEPGSMRDGRWLIGQGMAAAIYTHWRWPAKARVTLNGDGGALVEAGSHDLGTGTYTVMQQVAADALGLPLEKVTVGIRACRIPTPRSARRRWPMPALRYCWRRRRHATRRLRWRLRGGMRRLPARRPTRSSPPTAGSPCRGRTSMSATGNCSNAMAFPRWPPMRRTTRCPRPMDRRRSSASPRCSPKFVSTPNSVSCG